MTHLDYRKAGPDDTARIADGERESAKSVAAGDQPGPVRMVERRGRRMRGHEIGPARIAQLQNHDIAHVLAHWASLTGTVSPAAPLPDVFVLIKAGVSVNRQPESIVRGGRDSHRPTYLHQ